MQLRILAASLLAATASAAEPATFVAYFPAEVMAVDLEGNVLGFGHGELTEVSPAGVTSYRSIGPMPARSLALAPDGRAYVGAEGLYTYSPAPEREERLLEPYEVIDRVNALALGPAGELVLGGDYLTRYDPLTRAGELLEYESPWSVAVDPIGRVYYAIWNGSWHRVYRHEGQYESPTLLLDESGLGPGKPFRWPQELLSDSAGNVYALGYETENVFKITPEGGVSMVLDARGTSTGVPARGPRDVVADGAGGFVVAAAESDAVFRVRPGRAPEVLLDGRGDGTHGLDEPVAVARGRDGSIWVAGKQSRNLFRIQRDGTVQEIAGAALLAPLYQPTALAVDSEGVPHLGDANGVVVAVSPTGGFPATPERSGGSPVAFMAIDLEDRLVISGGDRVLRREASGWRELLGPSGDGSLPYRGSGPLRITRAGDIYTVATASDHVFTILWDGTVVGTTICEEVGPLSDIALHGEPIVTVTLSGRGGLCRFSNVEPPHALPESALGPLAVDEVGGVAALDFWGSRTLYLDPAERWTTLLSEGGTGSGHRLAMPLDVALGPDDSVYVAGLVSGNIFRITPDGRVGVPFRGGSNELGEPLHPERLAVGPDGTLYFQASYSLWRVNVSVCQDMVDNDWDGRIDEDDPDCARRGRESLWSCGLGPELCVLLAALAGVRRRRAVARAILPGSA